MIIVSGDRFARLRHGRRFPRRALVAVIGLTFVAATSTPAAIGQIAVHGETVYTMTGPPIAHGVVVVEHGRIAIVGPASEVVIPQGYQVLSAKVVTPGLIDAHATAGLTGIYNQPHDQDQLERNNPIQPELRAVDAVNIREQLVEYLRSFGITTIHTGHAPGELVSGQTMIIKTIGNTVEEAEIVGQAAVAATFGPNAQRSGSSPGTRGKQMAMLRQELIKAREYQRKRASSNSPNSSAHQEHQDTGESPPGGRDLRLETLALVLDGKLPLLITANRAQDIASALRVADEFNIRIWLDGAAEAYLLIEEIRAANIPVILHPTMARAVDEFENLSFETAAQLVGAGIPIAMQSGFEGYVPKTRVVLFEAALTAAHGLTFEQALATITRDAAKILGIDHRVGTLQVGLDGDMALFDGDPFEYTTHCVGVIIEGRVVSSVRR